MNSFNGYWVHVTCQGKELCDGQNQVEDINEHQFAKSIRSWRLGLPWVLDFISVSCMVDHVSTI